MIGQTGLLVQWNMEGDRDVTLVGGLGHYLQECAILRYGEEDKKFGLEIR